MKKDFIEVDGSIGEGGGQIFRTALAYSAVTRKPILIKNIRAKRKNPGLRPQHLAALKALATITNAKVEGAFVSSTKVYFEPRKIKGGRYNIDPGTAGSISLIIQAILPALLFAEDNTEIDIKGGTDVPMAPPIDAIRFVLIPFLNRIGANVELELIKRGHYPRGGGHIRLHVEPINKIKPIRLINQGNVLGIRGISHCVRLPRHVAERQAKAATQKLEKSGYKNIDIQIESYHPNRDPHLGPGSGIVIWAETTTKALLEADSLGARGKPAEKVGTEAAETLIRQIKLGGAVDVHNTDQLVPFMALADGISEIHSSEISLHTITAIEIAKCIIGARFQIDSEEIGKPGVIKCFGIGLSRE